MPPKKALKGSLGGQPTCPSYLTRTRNMEARRTFQQVGKTAEDNWKRGAHEDAVVPKQKQKDSTALGIMKAMTNSFKDALSKASFRDFPGGPVTKTPCSQCGGPGWGPRFEPWSEN